MPTIPTFAYELKYWQQGLTHIAGIDEVGMGALAGPVCAAAVIFSPDVVDTSKTPLAPLARGVTNASSPPSKGDKGGFGVYYHSDLKNKSRENRHNPTSAEKRLWFEILSAHKLLGLRFVRQKPLLSYIVDFYCPELMLAIEVDGDTHDAQTTYDNHRTKQLNNAGVTIIRYNNSDITKNLAGIYDNLKQKVLYLQQRNPPLTPLAKGVNDDHTLIRDSKQLSAQQREKAAQWIKENSLAWAVGEASVEEIDHYNILRAAHLAMRRAVASLKTQPELLLIDGRPAHLHDSISELCIIKGDQLCYSIAAASILAKVHRDQIMTKLGLVFPSYGWSSNKGYGSTVHKQALQQFGITPHHRRSYAPVAKIALI